MDITIFIRTKNEEALIQRCLSAVFSQKTALSFKVLILDSGSSDRTIELARSFPVELHSIPSSLFGYSSTLNAGIQLSKSELFVSLSGHAVPKNEHWLDRLIAPLSGNQDVVAAFSRQEPWDGVSERERNAMRQDFPEHSYIMTTESFREALKTGSEPYSAATFSNASSVVRRSFVSQNCFRDLPFSEDRCLAIDVLAANGSIAYASDSLVSHSHEPLFNEFRSVARRATVARTAINMHGYTVLNMKGSEQVGPPSLLAARLKVPLAILWLSVTLGLTFIRPWRRNRLRELRWSAASLGTTVGKLEGIARVRSADLRRLLEPADPQPILQHLGRA